MRHHYISLLKACSRSKDLAQARAISAHLAPQHGLLLDASAGPPLGDLLLTTLVKCGGLNDALQLFHRLPSRTAASWTAVISGYAAAGRAREAFRAYARMQQEGARPDRFTFLGLLKACSGTGTGGGAGAGAHAQELLQLVHAEAARCGCATDVVVGTCLVSGYGRLGNLQAARAAFDGVEEARRTVVTWTAMMAAYTQQGQPGHAVLLYEQMRRSSSQGAAASPSAQTFVALAQACGALADAEEGRAVPDGSSSSGTAAAAAAPVVVVKAEALSKGKAAHLESERKGYGVDAFVGSTLISMYGKCGSVADAQAVFAGLAGQSRNVVAWTALLAAYAGQQGEADRTVQLYVRMREDGVSPNARTLVSAVQSCGALAESGGPPGVGGGDGDGFAGGGGGAAAGAAAEVAVGVGKELHAEAWRRGCQADVFVCSSLISMYGKCGSVADARMAFDDVVRSNERSGVVAWNAMLVAYVQQDEPQTALRLYEEMQVTGQASPNARTLVVVLQACGMLADKEEQYGGDDVPLVVAASQDQQQQQQRHGSSIKVAAVGVVKAVHAEAARKGYTVNNAFVGNTLVNVYGKCGSPADARLVFDNLPTHSAVSCTAMLASYAAQQQQDQAGGRVLELYARVLEQGAVSADDRMLVMVLQGCGILAETEQAVAVMAAVAPGSAAEEVAVKAAALGKGKAVHADAVRKGYRCHTVVGNALISMYGKCGSVGDARAVFEGLGPQHRDAVSWNALLTVHAQQAGGGGEAADTVVRLYRAMQEAGVSADEVALVCVLQACGRAGRLDLCRQVHRALAATGKLVTAPVPANTLVHAYGMCGSIADAEAVFGGLPPCHRDVVSWTALIAGFARQGDCAGSLRCYDRMRLAGVQPNAVTFLSLLSACNHAGLLDAGVAHFESMTRDHGLAPQVEHYACVVDLLGRAGRLGAVERLLAAMPVRPDLSVWLSLLSACRKHGGGGGRVPLALALALARRAFECAKRVRPRDAAAYVLIVNVYADAGMWERVREVKALWREAGAGKRLPGQSWVQTTDGGGEEEVHSFVVGDRRHPRLEEVACLIEQVGRELGTCEI